MKPREPSTADLDWCERKARICVALLRRGDEERAYDVYCAYSDKSFDLCRSGVETLPFHRLWWTITLPELKRPPRARVPVPGHFMSGAR